MSGFDQIVRAHAARYPRMDPQDYGKLAYQSEFGPEHLIRDRDHVRVMLEQELAVSAGPAIPPEPIGNGLCRFHLEGLDTDAALLLLELFCRTAAEHQGTREGLEARLAVLEALTVPGMDAWLARWRAEGCPAVSHSQTFRDAYAPHYRLLAEPYARFFPALLAVDRLVRSGRPAIVAIDGRCGSGKTTLAALLARLFPCNVFHADDFYLPFAARRPDWRTTPLGNMDLGRLRREVLEPARLGKEIAYRAYDCPHDALRPALLLPPRPLTVVEGSYSLAPALRPYYDLTVFLTCSQAEQAARLQAREGAYYPAFPACWIPLEEDYHRTYDVEHAADLVADTTAFSR